MDSQREAVNFFVGSKLLQQLLSEIILDLIIKIERFFFDFLIKVIKIDRF